MDKMRKITLVKPYELREETSPVPEPKAGEVRVKVEKIGVCGSDLTIYRGLHPYVSYPLVMGHEYSGVVDKLGEGVSGLPVGTRVAAIPHLVCGECSACRNEMFNYCGKLRCTGAEADGAHTDYICIPEIMAVPIPDTMSIEDAALIEPACVAYHGARRAGIKDSDLVLVIGAGPIGVFCMQCAKVLGASKVFIADLEPRRLELAKTLGVDGVIDVSAETLEQGVQRLCGGDIDVFYDCVGEKGRVFNDILKIAKRGSSVVLIGVLQNEYELPNLPDFIQHELALYGTTMYVPADYRAMISLIDNGVISTAGMVTHRFAFEEIPEVLRKLDQKELDSFKIIIDM